MTQSPAASGYFKPVGGGGDMKFALTLGFMEKKALPEPLMAPARTQFNVIFLAREPGGKPVRTRIGVGGGALTQQFLRGNQGCRGLGEFLDQTGLAAAILK